MADLRDELCVDGEESIALPMGPGAAQPDEAAADAARLEASSAAAAGDWSAALAAWSAAIVASAEPAPQLFARRAEVLLHLKHPSAALEDANAALCANPDSARALKAKGLAHRYRGEWADAAKALGEAQAIDFDDSVVAVQKLCVDKAAILQKRRVIEQNAAAAASRREAAAAEARARAPPPPPPPSGGGVVRYVKTEVEYTALLGESRPVVIDWTAAWCGPCRTIAPLVEELAKKHSGVSFVKVDVDEAQFLAQKHGITSMPTFMRFSRRGVKVAEFKGADPAALRRMAEDAAKE